MSPSPLRVLFITSLLLTSIAPANSDEVAVVLSAGKSITNWHGQADVQSVSLEWTREHWKNVEAGFAVSSQVFWQPRSWFGYDYGNGNEKVQAAGASLLGRYRFRRRGSFRPYAELAIGPVIADKPVPAATSHFNLATQPGFGVEVGTLRIGYRFSHISNGGIVSRNPGLNVSSIVLAVAVRR